MVAIVPTSPAELFVGQTAEELNEPRIHWFPELSINKYQSWRESNCDF